MNLEDIQNNTIIICENDYKKQILKELSLKHIFLNVLFFSKKEFLEEYYFKYNEKAIYYLVNKYNYKIDIAKMYLDNLIYIDDNKEYKSIKLKFLQDLKKELDDNFFFIYNNYFKDYIKNYNFLVINYPYLEDFEIEIFNKYNAIIINDTGNNKHEYIYEFDSLEEEVRYVASEICKLIDNGIDINKIKIMGVDKTYYNYLKKIFDLYNLKINIETNNSLYGNIITKKFLEGNNISLENRLEKIKNDNSDIVTKIVNICNKYTFVKEESTLLSLIIEDFKNTKINNFKYQNYIEIIDVTDYVNDEYVFFMNFNAGSIPITFKDINYINDSIKEEVNLKKVSEINKAYKDYIKNKIRSIKNLSITYKNVKDEFYPSSLIRELNLNIVKPEIDILTSYSKKDSLFLLTKMEDELSLYNTISDNYYIYKNSLDNSNYKIFSNKYTLIDKNNLYDYLNNTLNLSYSSLNNYNKCSFKFYLANILKIDKYEETFEAFIGSVFHDVLEKCFINDLPVKEEIINYVKMKNKVLNAKESFFLNKEEEDIKYTLEVLKKKEYTEFDKYLFEKRFNIEKNRNNFNISFVGVVDKILYKEKEDKTLISIIDYKTGSANISLNYLPYGLNMQLPIYLYLVKKSNCFNNPYFTGFYLQNVLDKNIVKDNLSSYDEKRYDKLKLVGYSNSNQNILSEFDNSYKNSELIKGLKIKSDGNFSSYSKVLNNNQIDEIINMTEKIIDKDIKNILDSKFDINPKKIGFSEDVSCNYCKFKDICFKKNSDYLVLDDIKDLSFLGGEDNA